MRPRYRWQLRSHSLELGERTRIMGVVNVTPDSFYDGGNFLIPAKAVEHGLRLLEEGADLLDIGGESTRPGVRLDRGEAAQASEGKAPVSPEEELRRIMPVLEGILRARPGAILSVDTYKAVVAQTAVTAGAEIINDVSAFQWDPQMASVCAKLECGVVLMHTRGTPDQWRSLPRAAKLVSVVEHELANRLQIALERGVARSRIVLDPGFGFGKNFAENYPLLAQLEQLQRLGFPLLAGTSRKSFIGRTLSERTGRDTPPSDRLYGSLAAMVASILHGAHIVRVHDVKPAVEAAAVADEVLAAGREDQERVD
ncbi:MAG TPA: dihydropteroate synthase [Terriglobales bacterium]|nr:dihydropteroate synthase [Terriglobales bacterium]